MPGAPPGGPAWNRGYVGCDIAVAISPPVPGYWNGSKSRRWKPQLANGPVTGPAGAGDPGLPMKSLRHISDSVAVGLRFPTVQSQYGRLTLGSIAWRSCS